MDLKASKIELIKSILSIESEELIDKIKDVLTTGNKDFWLELTDGQRAEIELGLKQMENGETESWEDVLKRVS
jgi:hypothetical protein